MHWRRTWQPTPVFLPGESQGQGRLVGCVYGVTKSRTRLKWLSSNRHVVVACCCFSLHFPGDIWSRVSFCMFICHLYIIFGLWWYVLEGFGPFLTGLIFLFFSLRVLSHSELCPTLCDPMDCSPPGSSVHRDFPGKNTGVDCHALLKGIFPTQGSNPGLPHCRRIHCWLSHQGRGLCIIWSFVCPVTKWCLTFCDPMDCRLPGSSVNRISQARILQGSLYCLSSLLINFTIILLIATNNLLGFWFGVY